MSSLDKIREDVNKGFELTHRHISALGTRWGLLIEKAFREGLRDLLEREFGYKVERWTTFDEKCVIFSYLSEVDVDVVIKDEKIILIEISSHVRASDVVSFKRKAELHQEKSGKRPSS